MPEACGSSAQLPLAGERVLVTRPAHQAAELCLRLKALGAEPVTLPLLEIVPTPADSPSYQTLKHCFFNLDQYHSVIFVSANAARLGYDWIDSIWPQLPVRVNWLAVGSATQRTLVQAGIEAQTGSSGMDSEALLQHPQLHNLTGKRVLICRGQGGRELLREQLTARGAQVDYAELYSRESPVYSDRDIESIIYNQPLSVMLVSSGEALDNFANLLARPVCAAAGSSLKEVRLIVPSDRVAEAACQYGFRHCVVANNATDDAMIQAIRTTDTID